jgi:hypothetical protein
MHNFWKNITISQSFQTGSEASKLGIESYETIFLFTWNRQAMSTNSLAALINSDHLHMYDAKAPGSPNFPAVQFLLSS